MHIPPKSLNRFLRQVRGPLLVMLLALWTSTAHADPIMGNQIMSSPLEPNTLRNTNGAAAESAPTSEFTQLLQDLSPIPVLALGLLGLIWIRRHTADL